MTAGWDFELSFDEPKTNPRTIWVKFKPVEGVDVIRDGEWLNISSRDDYFEDCDPEYETEMFDSYSETFKGPFTSYIPTRERLDKSAGGDWY